MALPPSELSRYFSLDPEETFERLAGARLLSASAIESRAALVAAMGESVRKALDEVEHERQQGPPALGRLAPFDRLRFLLLNNGYLSEEGERLAWEIQGPQAKD
jgi:hypothetical protein